jgi:hypothetical protein
MSTTFDQRPTPAASTRFDRAAPMLPLLVSVVVLAIAVPWQTRWGVNPDTSWIITICERVLGGARLYVDIIETNPPFSIWLYLPVVSFANWLGVAPEYLVHDCTYGVCLFGLSFAAFIARRADFPDNPRLFVLLPAFLALLVILPGSSFSEREHLGMALLLPLLALMAWRASQSSPAPDLAVAILAGLCGSVIVLVKPYYAVVILAPALYVAWRRRSFVALLAPEYWTIGAVSVTYLACVVWFYPEFLRHLYPLLAETYLSVRRPLEIMLTRTVLPIVALCLLRLLRPGRAPSPIVVVMAIASLAALGPLIYQGKGWTYHTYPAVFLCLAALLCRFGQAGTAGDTGMFGGVSKLLLAFAMLANAIPFFATQKPGPSLVAAIREATERPTVSVIGTDLSIGHPLTRMVDGRWLSAYCSDWLGAFSTYLGKVAELAGDPERAAYYAATTERFIDAKLAEFTAAKPDLLLFQKEDPFWTDRLLQREAFALLLKSDYHLLIEDNAMRVYLRNGVRNPQMSAAEGLQG